VKNEDHEDFDRCLLHVGNLPKCSEEDLREQMKQEVTTLLLSVTSEVEIVSMSVRGHAFLKAPKSATEALLALDGTSLGGRSLTVQRAQGSALQELTASLKQRGIATPRAEVTPQGTALWSLPVEVGGGLVAVPAEATKQATIESLAKKTSSFIGAPPFSADASYAVAPPTSVVKKEAEVAGRAVDNLTEAAAEEACEEAYEEPCEEAADEAFEGSAEEEVVIEEAAGALVRNLCIIAHVDHGKTTLSDTLLAASGALSSQRAGTACALDVGLEKERGITIYSSAVGLRYPQRNLQLTLVDCPGHVEFGSEVAAALRLTDGALLLVDASEGVCVQTEAVLRQALASGVQPVLVLNKLDRLLPEPEPRASADEPLVFSDDALERTYNKMIAAIDEVNAIIASHGQSTSAPTTEAAGGGGGEGEGGGTAKVRVSPLSLEDGTVCFGSAYFGWLATLDEFARLFAKRAARAGATRPVADTAGDAGDVAGGTAGDMVGDDAAAIDVAAAKALRLLSGSKRAHYVKKMCLAPLAELHALAGALQVETIDVRLRAVGGVAMALDASERALQDVKQLRRAVFRRLLPASRTLLDMITTKLPSPQVAQQTRCQLLLGGGSDADGRWVRALRACDPQGPLYMYVAKQQPVKGTKNLAAVARVFSGTARPGADVFLLDGNSSKPRKARISRVLELTALGASGALQGAGAGAVCALVGIEKACARAGTLCDEACAPALREMTFSVAPVEFCAVAAPAGSAARHLAEALPVLQRTDPLIKAYFDKETAEHVLAAAGTLHMEACVHKLRELMGTDGPRLQVQPANFAHREGVAGRTPRTDAKPGALGKTANKHNRLWLVASRLSARVVDAIEGGIIRADADVAARARHLVDLSEADRADRAGAVDEPDAPMPWDSKDARRILAFGPDGTGANVLVDSTFGVQGVDGIAEHLVSAFQELCESGPLAKERLRGVRIDLVDAKIHGEAAQRKAPQVVPAARRAMASAVLGARPTLCEPMMSATLSAPLSLVGEAYDEFATRRAIDIGHDQGSAGHGGAGYGGELSICTLEAQLPLVESRGLSEKLRGRMGGRAGALLLRFAGWAARDGEAWVVSGGGEAAEAVQQIRDRKNLGAGPPSWEALTDRL